MFHIEQNVRISRHLQLGLGGSTAAYDYVTRLYCHTALLDGTMRCYSENVLQV